MKLVLGLMSLVLIGVPASRALTPKAAQQELVNVEEAWKKAVIDRDAAALQRVHADEYIATDQEGAVWNKAEDVEIDSKGVSRATSFKLEDLKVQIYGDVAVVTGRNDSKGTLLGRTASGKVRFTDVFVKRDGRWQCVASQATSITVR